MNLTQRIAGLLEAVTKLQSPGVWAYRIQYAGDGSMAIIVVGFHRGQWCVATRWIDARGLRSGKIRQPNKYILGKINEAVAVVEHDLKMDLYV